MKLPRRTLMLVLLVPIGCGTPAVSTPVASVTEPSASSGSERPATTSGANESIAPSANSKPTDNEPLRYAVRKPVASSEPVRVPRVLLSASHAKLCTLQVGEPFPSLTLPKLGGQATDLSTLRGKQATVVLFWQPDRWMARTALVDMQRDVADQFAAADVAVVGIAVRQAAGQVQAALNAANASFPQFVDSDGAAFATVGTVALPRLYVLDPSGHVVWFDIEYSEGTRRELWQTLRALTSK